MDDWTDDDWDAYQQSYDMSESRDFAEWSTEYWDALWNAFEELKKLLEYCPGVLDQARFIDFLEFVSNTSSSCPEPSPKIRRPLIRRHWNFTNKVDDEKKPKAIPNPLVGFAVHQLVMNQAVVQMTDNQQVSFRLKVHRHLTLQTHPDLHSKMDFPDLA